MTSPLFFHRDPHDSGRIWRHFARTLQPLPHVSKPEEPLEDYTTDQLQDWVLRRHNIQVELHSSSGTWFTVLNGRYFIQLNFKGDGEDVLREPQLYLRAFDYVNQTSSATPAHRQNRPRVLASCESACSLHGHDLCFLE